MVIWTSRIILPEHREALFDHDLKTKEKKCPEHDPQRFEELDFITRDSIEEKVAVAVTVFGLYEDYVERGIVADIDPMLKRLKLIKPDDDFVWIPFRDILNIDGQ